MTPPVPLPTIEDVRIEAVEDYRRGLRYDQNPYARIPEQHRPSNWTTKSQRSLEVAWWDAWTEEDAKTRERVKG
jgi:hypothetical protein